ncbi:hypothetical protein J1614_001561 [Plenodomus biglobosus]|nr:hypothetical protein J1614_001561 [Plenodomus biglobosus]
MLLNALASSKVTFHASMVSQEDMAMPQDRPSDSFFCRRPPGLRRAGPVVCGKPDEPGVVHVYEQRISKE